MEIQPEEEAVPIQEEPNDHKFWQILVIVLFIVAVVMTAVLIFYDSIFTNKKSNFLLMVDADCPASAEYYDSGIKVTKTNSATYILAQLSEDEYERLEQADCVQAIYTTAQIEDALSQVKNQLKEEIAYDIKTQGLKRTIVRQDVTARDNLKEYLHNQHEEIPLEILEEPGEGIIAPYQYYVTPEVASVQDFTGLFSSLEEIYLAAAYKWVWVSEETLNNQEEKWLTPDEFLTETPDFSTNPVSGKNVSDCSEQANTLASSLRASGVAATDVRVVLGTVNFEGSIGGHAWVELKQGDNWLILDPTSGSYYDDETGQFIEALPFPFDYFLYHEFPVVERWYFYNDQYFEDLTTGLGNAPSNWSASSSYNAPLEYNVNNLPQGKRQIIKNKYLNKIFNL